MGTADARSSASFCRRLFSATSSRPRCALGWLDAGAAGRHNALTFTFRALAHCHPQAWMGISLTFVAMFAKIYYDVNAKAPRK